MTNARNLANRSTDFVSVRDFGARGDGVTDDTAAIQAAFDAATNGQCIEFGNGDTFKTTAPIVVSPSKWGLVIKGNGSVIRAYHNSNGLVLTSTNENYSRHKIYDLTITGPNVGFPANPSELAGTSTGYAVKIGRDDTTNVNGGYLLSFINCTFQNFYGGVYLQAALMCEFRGGGAFYNQYGVYIDGGATNANVFDGFTIRQNRIAGIYSSGRTGGSLTNATANVFSSCEIETNIPYDASAGGYPATFDATKGYGVKIANSYDFVFENCYFENHNYSIVIASSSDDNMFVSCRFDGGGGGSPVQVRPGGILVTGGACNNNTFDGCKIVSASSTVVNVTVDTPASCYYNQFRNNVGFVFDYVNAGVGTFIQNNRKTQGAGLGGQEVGLIQLPLYGYKDNPAEGTAPGSITGVGTATATLNTFGFGEFQFGSNITGNTTITSISGQRSGQILVLRNYQIAYSVTLKSAASGTGNIVLKSFADAVFNNYGQHIVLYVTSGLGGTRCYEIGRNF